MGCPSGLVELAVAWAPGTPPSVRPRSLPATLTPFRGDPIRLAPVLEYPSAVDRAATAPGCFTGTAPAATMPLAGRRRAREGRDRESRLRRAHHGLGPEIEPLDRPHGTRTDVKGIRVFTYPKVIFMFPTLIVALICGFGMMIDRRPDRSRAQGRETAGRSRPARRTPTPAAPRARPVQDAGEPLRRALPGRLRLQPADHGDRLPPVHDHRRGAAGRVPRLLLPLDRGGLRRRADARGAGADGEHLRRRQRRVLLPDRGDHGASSWRSSTRPGTSTTGRSCPTRSSTTTAR